MKYISETESQFMIVTELAHNHSLASKKLWIKF